MKKKTKEIRVLAKNPGGTWYTLKVENSLAALQGCVGGYIETVTVFSDACIICNEEGRIRKLPYCCTIFGTEFVGNVLFVGIDGEEFTDSPLSLSEFLRNNIDSGAKEVKA